MARGQHEIGAIALDAASWPGYAPQSWVIPPLLALGVGRLRGRRAAFIQLASWGVAPLGAMIKRIVHRPRPVTAHLPFKRSKGSSFPSTHVAVYAACFGSFAIQLASRPGPTRALALLPISLIAAIGPSRVRQGEHRRSDVVAGYLLGGAYLATLEVAQRRVIDARAGRDV